MTAPKKKLKAESDVETVDAPPVKPGEPGYDWSQDYPDEKFMVYTAKSGVTVGLAASKGRIKPGDFRRMSHMQDWQATFYMIEKIASPAALAVSDDFDDDEYSDMMTAWTEWANTTVGES